VKPADEKVNKTAPPVQQQQKSTGMSADAIAQLKKDLEANKILEKKDL